MNLSFCTPRNIFIWVLVQDSDGGLFALVKGALVAQLVLGCLDEETAFVEFDVDCDADLILGYDSNSLEFPKPAGPCPHLES